MVDFFRPYITSSTCQYSILKKIIRIIIRPVQDTFKKYLDTDTCPKKYLDTDTLRKKYLDTDAFKIPSEKSI